MDAAVAELFDAAAPTAELFDPAELLPVVDPPVPADAEEGTEELALPTSDMFLLPTNLSASYYTPGGVTIRGFPS